VNDKQVPKKQVMSHFPSQTAQAEDIKESVNADIHTLGVVGVAQKSKPLPNYKKIRIKSY